MSKKHDECKTPDENDFEVVRRRPASSFPLGSRQNPADYVIVGLGTAGTPLARFLSEDLTTSVIVLEAGENRGDDPRVQNAFLFGDPGLANDPRYSFARAFDSLDINPGLAGALNYPDHRLWGGGSSANGLSGVRSTRDIYDAWGAFNTQWSYSNLLPVMLYMEQFNPNATTPPNPAQRGFVGPLCITQDDPLPSNPLYTAIAAATNSPPFPPGYIDYNDPTYGDVGVTASQWYRTAGPTPGATSVRCDAQTAWLTPDVIDPVTGLGVGGRKLTVLSRATAVKVIIENGTAVGVRYFFQDNPDDVREVFARKKVILSAGTIATAQLMQLSGIGPAALLTSLGIEVVLNNPHVGQHIDNHYGPNAAIRQAPDAPFALRVDQFYTDISGNNIPQPPDGVRRAQVYVLPFNAAIPHAILAALQIENVPAYSFIGFLMRPQAEGEVNIVSIDPLTNPEIKFHYYQGPGGLIDLQRSVDLYKVYANISLLYTGQMPLYPTAAQYPAGEYPGGMAAGNAGLEQAAKDVTLIAAYHAAGSCRMGDVVDGNLDVIGVPHLACADMSVAPVITTGNTAYPAYLIGLVKAKIEGATVPY